jgi:hypothetical protein
VEKIIKDKTRQFILIAPSSYNNKTLFSLAIDDPLILDSTPLEHLFLPPDCVEEGTGIGKPPWGDTAAWLLSGEPRCQQQHHRLFTPKFVKLTDSLLGKSKAQLTPAIESYVAATECNNVTGPGEPVSKFRSLEAALNANWEDVAKYATGTEYRTYTLDDILDDNITLSSINTTPLYTYITVNRINVVAILDSGSSTTILSDHPDLSDLFQFQHKKIIPPISLSGIGNNQATHFVQQKISFRGAQGQYINITPKFLIAKLANPTIIIGNDILSKAKIVTVAADGQAFALAMDHPEFIIPCSIQGEVPSSHIKQEPRIHKSYIPVANPSSVFHANTQKSIDELTTDTFSGVNLPKATYSPHQLSLNQFEYLCHTFTLDRFRTVSDYPEFDAILKERLNINLERDKLVIFTLLLILRSYPKAFSFPGNVLGRFTAFQFDLKLIDKMPPVQKSRHHSFEDQEIIKKWLKELISLQVYKIVDHTEFASDIHVVKKPGKDPRPTGDYRLLNLYTKDIPMNINHMEKVLHWCTNKPMLFISDCDNNKGFYQ